MSGVKRGDLAVLKWPPWQVDRFERIRVGESRRSITLWDNPEMRYSNGRFPNRAIWGDQVVLVLNVMNVIVEMGVANRMAHIFAPEGFGWVLADNLEGIC
jgi:hypothetical protein